ncbi:4,5:9,10-diseco-3-hydroxy-5,9,17-trioxoandrosta-1(10),2-diene-4-oate hydrolase [Tsuneonella dongtanensis]|uniref:4,5:9,10-diseco-3-hydroxy-5,9, 17-trioxoandrosta-1(10),2-diene-4-oate hydrolase n=1 Tax=Tsuneonella dongtanensis TaxID=692370 RepID=A0A1B2AG54_9SPHN|nr:alpha/beta hydrolase [Tsuneonella dongtanensis]ANY21133.1 4,5:9,10-diseco-3-hydroxy-5,9,17-trioxoandrosta-1(10),2-diene-4-oate hydrolase [Tsuneonella dongtanensis]
MSIRHLAATLLLASCATPSPPVKPVDGGVELLNARVGKSQFREGWSGDGEARIHYVEGGKGPVVLFVHGFPSTWYVWADQLAAFATCRRVIAIDAPGANLSGRPGEDAAYRIGRLAARLDALVDELGGGGKVTLVGHDWGGALVWSYAEWKPDKVERLAVFSAPPYDLFLEMAAGDPEQRARSGYMNTFRSLDRETISARGIDARIWKTAYGHMVDRGVLTPAEGELFRKALTPAALDAGMAWYRANMPPFDAIDLTRDSWPAVGASTPVPTLLVEGSEDRTFVDDMALRARGHAGDLTALKIDGVAHWTPFEKPDEANAALGRFLGLPGGECPKD